METETEQDYITLKWGTLKSWNVKSAEGKALLEKYGELGYSMSAMAQHDTPEQKEIICKLIDLMPGKIYLDWEGKCVSKEAAKKYVLEYGLPTPPAAGNANRSAAARTRRDCRNESYCPTASKILPADILRKHEESYV